MTPEALEGHRNPTSLGVPARISWNTARPQSPGPPWFAPITSGTEVLFRVLTEKHKLSFEGTPADGKLKVAVQALSETQPPGPTARLKVNAPR